MKKRYLFLSLCFFLIPFMNSKAVELASNATSAIIIEYSTGKIIFEKNANERLAPASMTKIMTMLLAMEAIENGKLNLEDEDLVPWYNITPTEGYILQGHAGGNAAAGGDFSSNDSRNFYYTYSKGNITYSGTGHEGVSNVDEELRLLVNTIVKAYRGANHRPDIENYRGRPYTDYRKTKIVEEFEDFLSSLDGWIIYKHEILSAVNISVEPGAVDVSVKYAIYPKFTIERYILES